MFEIRNTEEKLQIIRSGMGKVIGPLFFGWLPALVLALWITQWLAASSGTAGMEKPEPKMLAICLSALFVCAWLWTIRHGLELNYSKRTLTRATRQLGIWLGRPKPIPEGATLRLDLCQGDLAEAMGTNEQNIYMRLVLVVEGDETVLIKKLVTPPGSPAVTVSAELRRLGEHAADKMGVPLSNKLENSRFIRVIAPPGDGRTHEEINITKPIQKQAVGPVLFIGLLFCGLGVRIATTDILVVGLLVGCVGLVVLFGAVWLVFRSYQVSIRPERGEVEVRSGWRGATSSTTYPCDEGVRLVLHVRSQNQQGLRFLYSLALATGEKSLAVPTDGDGYFTDIYPQALRHSTQMGIPLELNGAITCQAQDKLLSEATTGELQA